MGFSHGWLSPFLTICAECVRKSKLLATPMMCNISTPLWVDSHSHTTNFFFLPAIKKKKPTLKRLTKWFAALDLSFNKVFDPFMCGRFFFFPLLLPRLSALSQWDVCHCLLHVLNLSFDDLLLTHGINLSVKLTELCETAKDLPIAFFFFCLTEERNFWEAKKKKQRFDLKLFNLYENKSKSEQHTKGLGKY